MTAIGGSNRLYYNAQIPIPIPIPVLGIHVNAVPGCVVVVPMAGVKRGGKRSVDKDKDNVGLRTMILGLEEDTVGVLLNGQQEWNTGLRRA